MRIVDGLAVYGWYDGIQDTDIAITIYDFLTTTQYGAAAVRDLRRGRSRPRRPSTRSWRRLTGGAGGSLGDVLGRDPAARSPTGCRGACSAARR